MVTQRLRDEIEEAVGKLHNLESEVVVFAESVQKRHAEIVDSIVELRQRLGAIL